jgi:hypothetical protein
VSDIEFGEPPPPSSGVGHCHAEIARQLRDRPGDWALVLRGVRGSYGTSISKGRLVPYQPAGSFEAVCRTVDSKNRLFDIWARYVGDPS